MKKFLFILLLGLPLFFMPKNALAAGASVSGGGDKFIGDTFSVTISATGATFDSIQGTIAVSGPVDIVSITAGSATWLPGKAPENNSQFVGITAPTDSLKVATVKLKGKSAGSGAVTVSGVKLALKGAVVGSDSGKASFTIAKKPNLPALVKVSSSSHPDQNASYEATTVALSWEKDSGIVGFSYFFDQNPDTVPNAKKDSADTSVSYPNQALGTYYFHIRAQNADGWGGTTHFKVNIKEPDPKIDETIAKPGNITISKDDSFSNDIKNGTISGIKVSGLSLPGYTVTPKFTPEITAPEGKNLSITALDDGTFSILIDFPISTGTRKLTLQGQKEKTLTPVSDEITFEISQARGGTITILTDEDILAPAPAPAPVQVKGEHIKLPKVDFTNKVFLYQLGALVLVIASGITAIILFIKRRRHF